jgi:hypothetical protein
MDALLLTLINAVACLAFPKLLSIFLTAKSQGSQAAKMDSLASTNRIEVTTFPYCTTYSFTGRDFCKFSPNFCDRCSHSLRGH